MLGIVGQAVNLRGGWQPPLALWGGPITGHGFGLELDRKEREQLIVNLENEGGIPVVGTGTKQQAIEEITRRLVEYYSPVRVYLFGSEARGEAGPDSDLDFCVVLPDDAPRACTDPVFTARSGESVRLPTWSGFRLATSTREPPTLPLRCQRRFCAKGELLYGSGRIAA